MTCQHYSPLSPGLKQGGQVPQPLWDVHSWEETSTQILKIANNDKLFEKVKEIMEVASTSGLFEKKAM